MSKLCKEKLADTPDNLAKVLTRRPRRRPFVDRITLSVTSNKGRVTLSQLNNYLSAQISFKEITYNFGG